MAIGRAWCIALLLLAARSPEAAAQGVARSFEQLQLLVRAGDTVSVRDAVGAETTGRIDSVSSSTLTFHQGEKVDEEALKALLRAAVTLNACRAVSRDHARAREQR